MPKAKSKGIGWDEMVAWIQTMRKDAKARRAAIAIEIEAMGVEAFRDFQFKARQSGWMVETWALPIGTAAKASLVKGKTLLVTITVTTPSDHGAIVVA